MPRRITVTQEDIDRAERGVSSTCAIAVAVARQIPEAVRIMVDTQLIRYTDAVTGERLGHLTPFTAQQYVVNFDAGDKIEPFTFLMPTPFKIKRDIRTERGKEVQRQLSRERLRAAREKRPVRKIKVEIDGEGPVTVRAKDARRAAPSVFRQKTRTYGMRALRVNRDHGRGDGYGVPEQE